MPPPPQPLVVEVTASGLVRIDGVKYLGDHATHLDLVAVLPRSQVRCKKPHISSTRGGAEVNLLTWYNAVQERGGWKEVRFYALLT